MSNTLAITMWSVIFLTAVANPLTAQERSIEPGARVRIKAPTLSKRPIVGTFEGVRDSILLVRGNRATTATEIRLGQIERLDVSQGKKSNAGAGALAGLLSGAALGAGFGLVACGSGSGCEDFGGTGTIALFTGAIGAGGGLLLGVIIGAATQSDRWEEVAPDRLRVGLTLNQGRGVGLGLSFAW